MLVLRCFGPSNPRRRGCRRTRAPAPAFTFRWWVESRSPRATTCHARCDWHTTAKRSTSVWQPRQQGGHDDREHGTERPQREGSHHIVELRDQHAGIRREKRLGARTGDVGHHNVARRCPDHRRIWSPNLAVLPPRRSEIPRSGGTDAEIAAARPGADPEPRNPRREPDAGRGQIDAHRPEADALAQVNGHGTPAKTAITGVVDGRGMPVTGTVTKMSTTPDPPQRTWEGLGSSTPSTWSRLRESNP